MYEQHQRKPTTLSEDLAAWCKALWGELKVFTFWFCLFLVLIGLAALVCREVLLSVWFAIRGM